MEVGRERGVGVIGVEDLVRHRDDVELVPPIVSIGPRELMGRDVNEGGRSARRACDVGIADWRDAFRVRTLPAVEPRRPVTWPDDGLHASDPCATAACGRSVGAAIVAANVHVRRPRDLTGGVMTDRTYPWTQREC